MPLPAQAVGTIHPGRAGVLVDDHHQCSGPSKAQGALIESIFGTITYSRHVF
jgi:hypothetical protein